MFLILLGGWGMRICVTHSTSERFQYKCQEDQFNAFNEVRAQRSAPSCGRVGNVSPRPNPPIRVDDADSIGY